jgi:hypothetical protein
MRELSRTITVTLHLRVDVDFTWQPAWEGRWPTMADPGDAPEGEEIEIEAVRLGSESGPDITKLLDDEDFEAISAVLSGRLAREMREFEAA